MTETIGWEPMQKPLLLPGQLAADLGASARGVTALLQCTGWPHLYRLTWPITALKSVRRASLPAAWTDTPSPARRSLSAAPETAGDTEAAADQPASGNTKKRWRKISPHAVQPDAAPYELDDFF